MFYRYDADGRLALVEKRRLSDNYKWYYYVITNSRGDVLEIHNGPGELTAKYTYDAWGKLISITNASGAALGTNSFAYQISVRYRGYVYDNETGLYYLQIRYYDPDTGRFINCDDVNYIGITESEVSYNPFTYCENEPVNGSDPSGRISVGLSMAIGATLGVIGLYIMDIIINLYYARIQWYKPVSSVVDYISAAISGALSMISIKKLSSVISASIAGATYILNCWTNQTSISICYLISTIGVAVILDLVGGNGIDLSNRIGIIKTSRSKLKTLVSSKKISMYKDKIVKNIYGLVGNTFSTLFSNIASRLVDESKIIQKCGNAFLQWTRRVIRI